jgi:hypothetical protein
MSFATIAMNFSGLAQGLLASRRNSEIEVMARAVQAAQLKAE